MTLVVKDKEFCDNFIASGEDITYFHIGTMEFMGMSFKEFEIVMLIMKSFDIDIIAVIPRSHVGTRFDLVLSQHATEIFPPCVLAMNCSRMFQGISYLANRRCWTCKKNDVKLSKCARCNIARYCSKECQIASHTHHKNFCKMVKKRNPRIADASENMEI